MNIKLNRKMIQEICGSVSFKRGEAFYRSNRVVFEHYDTEVSKAIVNGAENFHVTIKRDSVGGFNSKCTCPSLASFDKECQHVAAVLLAIFDYQRQGISPMETRGTQDDSSTTNQLSEGLLNLFNGHPSRSSGHQLHFENREVLHVEFTCKPVDVGGQGYLFEIELKVNNIQVQNIEEFLQKVKEGNSCVLSIGFGYNPDIHCFLMETDAVIRQLIQVVEDERVFVEGNLKNANHVNRKESLLIPPSSWVRLLPLLIKAPMVRLKYHGKTFGNIQTSTQPLPLQFDFLEVEGKGYQLKIKGLTELIILNAYDSVLSEGKLILLKHEDCQRLFDLKKMLDISGTNTIPITKDQINFFIEKVVPGLRKLGAVQLSGTIAQEFLKTPLVAKLYLDRVNNRLLAGLEFHYEHLVLNPLENREIPGGSLIIKDIEKEDEILQLLDNSLFAKTDGGYIMQNEELEYEFLYHTVPKLQKLVQIYATTAVRNRIFRGNAPPQIRVKAHKERTNWLEFKFEMDGIPEKQIREVLDALEEKRKYFRLRNGSLLSLETREFEELNRFMNSIPVQNQDFEGGMRVPLVRGLANLEAVDTPDIFKFEESFQTFLEEIQNPSKIELEAPENLAHILREYQLEGFKWLKTLASYGFGGILADDMGLGKTLQSITYIQSELDQIRKKKQPVLIVCPSSLTYNWLSEFLKFTPGIQAIVITGNQMERQGLQDDLSNVDVVITSYPLLRKDIKWYEAQFFRTVFFDEAQAFKNPTTQTFKSVKRLKAQNRFALTGTPVENSIEELWSIFHVVFPELFLGIKEFSNLTTAKVSRRIRPFLLRRLKEEVLSELPEKIESMDFVELLPEQKKLYSAYLAKLRHKTLKHLDKDTIRKNRIKILAGLTRLRQICCHPSLFVEGYSGTSAKFEQLKQILEECELSGRRILIFSQFTKMLEIIGRHLAFEGKSFFYLDGQTPAEERVQLCNRFNSGEKDIFLISLKAGGTGLNLTGADTVILYDLWWNPAVEEQAMDRAHRMGQGNTVQVIKLISRGTIEEKMNELQERKRHLIEEIIDPEDKTSSTLTEEDIRELLMN